MATSGMTPRAIKLAVWNAGTNLTELAEMNGLSESSCRVAIRNNFCPSGEKAIIDLLKIDPHKLWPNRYDKAGNRIIGRSRANTTKLKPVGHRQKVAVV